MIGKFVKNFAAVLKMVYRWILKIAHFIGRINTTILFTLFYFFFLGIAKAVVLLGRKDLLDQRWKDRESFWKERKNLNLTRESLLNPY